MGACNIDSLFCYLLWEYAGEDLYTSGEVFWLDLLRTQRVIFRERV